MNTPNPVMYEYCRSAWKQYRRDMGLPVASPPGQEPEVVETGAVGRLLRALWLRLAPPPPAARSLRQHGMQRSAARQGIIIRLGR